MAITDKELLLLAQAVALEKAAASLRSAANLGARHINESAYKEAQKWLDMAERFRDAEDRGHINISDVTFIEEVRATADRPAKA